MTALDIHRQLFAPALLPTKRGTWPGPPPHPALLPTKRGTWPGPPAVPGTSSDQTRHLARASALAASSQITRERET